MHKHVRRNSPEAVRELRMINHKVKNQGKINDLRRRMGMVQFAAIPVNEAVIKAFKNKQPLKGRAFESTGSEFKLFGHTIARHHPKGIEASTAGFPTAKTFDTLRALGINTRIQKGVTTIDGKQIDPNKSDFHLVPHENVLSERVYFSTPEQREKQKQRNKLSGGMVKQRQFREQTRIQSTGHKEAVPLSPTQIQPYDQKVINDITGVKSPIGQPIMGTEAHHIFFKSKYPGLALNPNNSIPQERTEHSLLHRLNRMSQMFALIEPIIMKKRKPKVIRKIDVRSGMIQTAKMIPSDIIIDNFIKAKQNFEGKSGVFDPINNIILDANIPEHKIRLQNLFESGDKNIGFNSITDTRKGQEKDIEKIRSQLRDIEKSGGNPALGFDEGSLEALNVVIGNDDDILNNLLEHQRSTGILSPNVEFRIIENPKFKKLE